MTAKQRVRLMAMMLTATAVASLPRAVIGQPAPTTAATTSASIDINALVDADHQQLARILTDSNAAPDQRTAAAARLASRQSPECNKILSDALVQLNVNTQLAVARALQDQADPDPQFIVPLFAALKGSSERPGEASSRLAEASAEALAAYKGNAEVVTQLIGFARKTPAPFPFRIQVIDALRSVDDRRSVEALIGIVGDAAEPNPIRSAAARSLTRLTGLSGFGQSPELWNGWFATMPKPDAEFRLAILKSASTRIEVADQRATDLKDYLRSNLTRQYLVAPLAQKQEFLLSLLKEAQPDVRAIGAGIIKQAIEDNQGQQITEPVKAQLRILVGDARVEVRQAAAEALVPMADRESLRPLITQLKQEKDEQVQRALILALNSLGSLEAVPLLLEKASNPPDGVQLAALRGLFDIGPKIAARKDLVSQTAATLRRLYVQHPRTAGANDVREAIVRAMVPLKADELLATVFTPILSELSNESPEMRRLAISAIGQLQHEDLGPLIVASLWDTQQPRVRDAAIKALGDLPHAEIYAPQIVRMIRTDNDAGIRETAWGVLVNLLPSMSADQLRSFADEFRDEASTKKKISILKALRDLQIKQIPQKSSPDDLFATRQDLAAAQVKEKEYADAAAEYAAALSYAIDAKKSPVIVTNLREERIKALLGSRDYSAVRDFAGQSFDQDSSSQQSLSGIIKSRVEELRATGNNNDALALIREALKIQPPLSDFYRGELSSIEKTIQPVPGTTSGPGAIVIPQTTPRTTPSAAESTANISGK